MTCMMTKPGNATICKELTALFESRFGSRKDCERPICAYKRGGFVRIRYAGWTSTVEGCLAWRYLLWLQSNNSNRGSHFDFAKSMG